jgi:cation transport ATPase
VFAEVLPEDKAAKVKELQADGRKVAAWVVLLTPAAGAVLMSASTVIVAINAQLLRRVRM